mmetsp:Transcript_4709/g.15187  ORF Transcript_4709/g.15187 Transcript_4709/m.15187 type:complete len:458 (-) Transcript_4709:602-1975(-)
MLIDRARRALRLKQKKGLKNQPLFPDQTSRLLDDLGDYAGTNGTAAFTNREAQTIFHGDRSNQGNTHLDVVTRHNHFHTFRQFARTGYVGGTEVELRTVALEERSMTTTFFFGQYVHFALELGVRSDGARNRQNLTTLNVVTLGTTQQNTNVLTSTAFVQQLAEHLNAGASRLDGIFDTNNLDLFTHLDNATLNTTGHNGTTTRDGEYVLDRHQERLIDRTLRLGDVVIQSFYQLLDSGSAHLVVVFAFQRHQRGTGDDRSVVTREVVLAQQITNFHLDQLEQLFIVYHVRFVQEHNDVRYTNLTGQQDVLTSLRHGAVSCGTNQDRAVHLRCTSDHVLHIVSVARAVYVSVVAGRRIVLNVGGGDGDTTRTLFRRVIDLIECACSSCTPDFVTYTGQGGSQSGFTMVYVTNGAYVQVRFTTLKFFFRHGYTSSCFLSPGDQPFLMIASAMFEGASE